MIPIHSNAIFSLRSLQITVLIACVVGIHLSVVNSDKVCAEDDITFFENRIRPVLVEHCYECHSQKSETVRGGLRVDTREAIRMGGDSGPAVVPYDVDESFLLRAIEYDDEFYQMPPDEKLSASVVEDFRHWIAQGAVDPRTSKRPAPDKPPNDPNNSKHWAFESPRIADVDETWIRDRADWAANYIDVFILKKQVENRLSPSPPAGDRAFIRRLYFDLIGLPPTFDRIRSYAESTDPNKKEKLVDSLLADARFGERWARHWLDLARYADTKGYVFTQKREYKDAYRYRDWVIQALNQDLSYAEFIRRQLAADQIASTADDPKELAAMGFLTLGRRFLNNRHDIIDDRIDVVTRGLMGLTVSCARCHDHKYDPIPTADYYSLYGVFANSREPGGPPSSLRLIDAEQLVDARIFVRGNPNRLGEIVPRHFLTALSNGEPFKRGSGRLELAEQIADPKNPLTARVFVNRVWGQLTGRFLVDTPSDFGTRSRRPFQQELLDAMAVQFVQSNWSIKSLIRSIVLSNTYGQDSADRPEALSVDPENKSFWKMNRRRLEFESLRDALLFVADQLDTSSIGGPSVPIVGTDPSRRRTLYAYIDRQNFPGLFRAFDVASPDTHSPRRFETTVPQQALYLMNHPFAHTIADAVVSVEIGSANLLPSVGVEKIYSRVLGRRPTPIEAETIIKTLFSEDADSPISFGDERWSDLAHLLLMSNEFAFLD